MVKQAHAARSACSQAAAHGKKHPPMRESLTAGTRHVARPAPLQQAVYDTLAELIANGTLRPGQHLVESDDLAEYLGVSRQPIREALQRLHGDGWVELRPAHGAFVHTPTPEEVVQLLGVRSVLGLLGPRRRAARDIGGHRPAARAAGSRGGRAGGR